MKKILLFSEDKKIFDTTILIMEEKRKLVWCTYNQLKKSLYSCADVVIMHFDKQMLKRGAFEMILKVKGKLGHSTPILAIVEGGTKQDIFCILKAGVYDYIETTENLCEYQKKVDELFRWSWYLKKYEFEKNSND